MKDTAEKQAEIDRKRKEEQKVLAKENRETKKKQNVRKKIQKKRKIATHSHVELTLKFGVGHVLQKLVQFNRC